MGDPRRRNLTDEFKREAVRLVTTSGRTIGEVAADLGVGKSTLTHWRRRFQEAELLSGPHPVMEKELARLRRENEVLRQERDLLKKAAAFFAKETSRWYLLIPVLMGGPGGIEEVLDVTTGLLIQARDGPAPRPVFAFA